MPKARMLRANRKSLIAEDLRAMLRDWDVDPAGLQVALTIDSGHDYWWFLEYGTGQYFGQEGYPDGELTPPSSAQGRSPSGGPYEIKPVNKKFLRFVNRNSQNVPRWNELPGELVFSKGVVHPGIPAQGFVRRAMAAMDLRLLRRLSELDEDDTLPTRSEVIEVLNEEVQYMLYDVQASVPESADYFQGNPLLDPDYLPEDLDDEIVVNSHLRDAFDVRLAR
jgi:hypothetical protein